MTTQNHRNSTSEKSLEFIRRTYYGNNQSDEDILAVCKKYNLSDKSDAIRIALRFLADNETARVPAVETEKPKRGRPSRTG